MHPKLAGNPDILLKDNKTIVFLHGCFWHKCRKCYKEPKSNKAYWLPKIERNTERDAKNRKLLKKAGWKIVTLWEHEIKQDLNYCMTKFT